MTPMQCSEARQLQFDRRRGTLSREVAASYERHLVECAACRSEDAADRELTAALRRHLEPLPLPPGVRRSLRARWLGPPSPGRRTLRVLASMAFGATLALAGVFAIGGRSHDSPMVFEAVNDHLRVLSSEHPLDVESSDMHQVKPWFSGKLDFAPLSEFAGDEEFPLQGGFVGYFIDRKAATLVFKRRLHAMTLLVFQAQGLPWPAIARTLGGPAGTSRATSRGFHVLLWRRQDLGYALVSDANETDLDALAARISGP